MSLTEARSAPNISRCLQPRLLGMGTVSPPALSQEQILDLALDVSGGNAAQQAWLTRLFRASGIKKRGTILAAGKTEQEQIAAAREFYPPRKDPADSGPRTGIRMQRYAAEAPRLAVAAARAALGDAQISPFEITHLFSASCTGFMAPGLDASLIEQLELAPTVHRLHIGFMGCHAAFNLLGAARQVIRADPGARILVCCAELCTLHLAYGWEPGKLIANALFADGGAAAILGPGDGTETDSPHLVDTASLLLPDSADAMTWKIGDHGFEMTLSPGVPTLIRQHLGEWCESWLARHNLKMTDIAHWAIHPGGPKILDAVAQTLNLPEHALLPSRQILADHGNMSSATILFILQQIFHHAAPGPCLAIGLGPGLMVEAMLFHN